ncbi:MAG: acyl-ACP--UDP-N-acetylglucosamine O-acyltransferase [Pseudomonadota bacterium]|nr:acyl-ACP--UDP-N-acetylglucosamine O-acyltransferase [Pseudomonadota bacterium]
MIHPSSTISKAAELSEGVTVGPFCVIRGNVRIGKGTILHNSVTVGSESGVVEIGENNQFFAGSVIGGPPQDLKYKGETTKLVVGNNNIIRECVTLNLGTVTGSGVTKIGNGNLIMAYAHLGHDCQIGNNNALANCCQMAGHVVFEDNIHVGGNCGFIQFTRVGKFAYIGAQSTINKDILPFSIAQGSYALCRATNKIGLERAGFSKDQVANIHKAIRTIIMGSLTLEEAVIQIEAECVLDDNVNGIIKFVKDAEKGIAR